MQTISLTADESLDLGSFVINKCTHNIYEFIGLSKDISLLPKVNSIGTGSTAYCADTKELYMYEKTTRQWYLQ